MYMSGYVYRIYSRVLHWYAQIVFVSGQDANGFRPDAGIRQQKLDLIQVLKMRGQIYKLTRKGCTIEF